MKNLWIQTENAFATWVADFSAVTTQPAAILAFVQATLASGTRHRIFEVVEAPVIGYRRERDGALSDVLGRLLEQDRSLDVFGFTGSAMMPGPPTSSVVETTLSCYDPADQRVERVVADLGAVLASLEPVPGSIPNGSMTHYPAVRVTGLRYTVVDGRIPVDNRPNPRPVAVYFGIHSDIWFPWVFGAAHPLRDLQRMFDNRELAHCHTPRLNAFLRDVAAAARQAGGSFSVCPDETAGPALEWVDDASVLLDWEPPDGIMPPEALNVPWYRL